MIQERIKIKHDLVEKVRNHPLSTKMEWDDEHYYVFITGTRHWVNPDGLRIRRDGNDARVLTALLAKLDEIWEKWRMFR